MKKNKPLYDISFEVAYKQLQEIVDKLQEEAITLEETINLYKKGKELSDYCNKLLTKAKFEIEEAITQSEKSKGNDEN